MANFPNQVERIDIDYRQLECLASPIRNEVFWAFAPDVARPVADVAEEIGKSASTVHYHLHALLEVGLLISVGERKRYARMETLYVWAAVHLFQQLPTASREYRDQSVKAFAAVARSMTREVEEMQRAVDQDPTIFDIVAFRHRTVSMSWEAAEQLKKLVQDFIDAVENPGEEEETVRMHVFAFSCPTRGTSMAFAKKRMKGK